MKQIKKFTFVVFDYELTINIQKQTTKDKELKEIYEKFNQGEILNTEDLKKLNESDLF